MKTANIYSEAKITLNSNCTTDNEPIHSIEFDGVVADIIGAEPTKREIDIFKIGILYERERLWDESVNLVDDKTMRKLLRYKKPSVALEISKVIGASEKKNGYDSEQGNIANLRYRVFEELNKEKVNCEYIEKKLGFKEGDIYKFIHSDLLNISSGFSPFFLCLYLDIPVEQIHSGYFRGYKGEEEYLYMINSSKETQQQLKINYRSYWDNISI